MQHADGAAMLRRDQPADHTLSPVEVKLYALDKNYFSGPETTYLAQDTTAQDTLGECLAPVEHSNSSLPLYIGTSQIDQSGEVA